MTFWDTFEWGLWFGGHVLYSCGEVLPPLLPVRMVDGKRCVRKRQASRRRFWGDFETEPMREQLEGMLGLRGLAPVAEGTFRLRQVRFAQRDGEDRVPTGVRRRFPQESGERRVASFLPGDALARLRSGGRTCGGVPVQARSKQVRGWPFGGFIEAREPGAPAVYPATRLWPGSGQRRPARPSRGS